jgi:PIN domain nuclease of toxin-antitoxin system
MNLLLDTHVLLWLLREPQKLSGAARQEISSAGAGAAVSIVTLWEIAIKVSLNKLQLPKPYHEIFPEYVLQSGLTLLPIEPEHLHSVVGLPWHHRDPFDRILVAQAVTEGRTLVTADSQLAAYGVPLLW